MYIKRSQGLCGPTACVRWTQDSSHFRLVGNLVVKDFVERKRCRGYEVSLFFPVYLSCSRSGFWRKKEITGIYVLYLTKETCVSGLN